MSAFQSYEWTADLGSEEIILGLVWLNGGSVFHIFPRTSESSPNSEHSSLGYILHLLDSIQFKLWFVYWLSNSAISFIIVFIKEKKHVISSSGYHPRKKWLLEKQAGQTMNCRISLKQGTAICYQQTRNKKIKRYIHSSSCSIFYSHIHVISLPVVLFLIFAIFISVICIPV